MFTRDVLKDQNAPAFAILCSVVKSYGLEVMEIDPSILRDYLEEHLSITITDLQQDKLQAAIVVATTDAYESNWSVFEACNHLFSGHSTDTDTINPLEAEELIVGIAEATLLKEGILEKDEEIKYDDEIKVYAGHVFHDYGMHKAPKLFPQAIMPGSVKAEDKQKNSALNELFEAHLEYVLNYLEKIE